MNSFSIGYYIGSLLAVFGLSFLVAYYLGRKRHIGFGWSWFFGIFTSPLLGLIITILSPKLTTPAKPYSKTQEIIGWITAVFFGFGTILQIIKLFTPYVTESTYSAVSIGIALTGCGIYNVIRNINKKSMVNVPPVIVPPVIPPNPNPRDYNGGHNIAGNTGLGTPTSPPTVTPHPSPVGNKEFKGDLYGKNN